MGVFRWLAQKAEDALDSYRVQKLQKSQMDEVEKPIESAMDNVQKLIQDLKSEDANVRCKAARELGHIGDSSVVPALVKALGDKDGHVRLKAAEALGKIEKPAVPALIEALGDKDAAVRGNAAWALGKIHDASAVPALIEALGDEDVGWRAAEALGKIADKCKTIEALESFEKNLQEGFATLRKKHPDKNKLIEAKMSIAKLMKKVAERKNELVSKRDMLLDDKPKPPKRGKMYQAVRRVRNG